MKPKKRCLFSTTSLFLLMLFGKAINAQNQALEHLAHALRSLTKIQSPPQQKKSSQHLKFDITKILYDVSIELLKPKPDETRLEQEKKDVLKAIEAYCTSLVAELPAELKKELGPWQENFERFKKIIQLIKQPITNNYKPENPNPNIELILNTALGLKPASTFDNDEITKNILETISKKSSSVDAQYIIKTIEGKTMQGDTIITQEYYMFPLSFIKKSYERIGEPLVFDESVPEVISPEYVQKFWLNYTESKPDTAALVLGLTPRSFQKFEDTKKDLRKKTLQEINTDTTYMTNIKGAKPKHQALIEKYGGMQTLSVFTKNAPRYALLLIHGVKDLHDKTVYQELYGYLLLYASIEIFGLQETLANIGREANVTIILARGQLDNAWNDFCKKNGIENCDEFQKNSIKKMEYILKKALELNKK